MSDEGKPEGGQNTGGGTGDKPAWLAQLPTNLKDNASLAGFKTIGDFAQAHLDTSAKVTELEGIKAKFDTLPKAPAKPEEYVFDKIEGIDEGLLNEARPEFLKAGLSNDQAKAVVTLEASLMKKRMEAYAAQSERDRLTAETGLKTEWGDKYPAKVENMKRFLTEFSKGFKIGDKPADVTEFLVRSRLGNDPFFIRFMDAVSSKIGEDTSPSGGSGGSGGKKEGMMGLYDKTPKP